MLQKVGEVVNKQISSNSPQIKQLTVKTGIQLECFNTTGMFKHSWNCSIKLMKNVLSLKMCTIFKSKVIARKPANLN